MEKKLCTILMLCIALFAMLAHGGEAAIGADPKSVEKWFEKLPHAKEKVTKLHFYLHDIVSGKNPSAVTVAQSNTTQTSPTSFAMVRVMDDALTVGPESNSTVLGHAQGIYATVSMEDLGLLMTFNFVFTKGKYKGSTLTLLGHNQLLHKYREIPILGGTGVFRLARGIATEKTVWSNMTSQDAVVEYHVVVLHY